MKKVRRRRLGFWRRQGALEFRRERKRYSDGSPYEDGSEVLFIRIRRKACMTAERSDQSGVVWFNDGCYGRLPAVMAAKHLRKALHAKAAARKD